MLRVLVHRSPVSERSLKCTVIDRIRRTSLIRKGSCILTSFLDVKKWRVFQNGVLNAEMSALRGARVV